jgi:hypothetical protein
MMLVGSSDEGRREEREESGSAQSLKKGTSRGQQTFLLSQSAAALRGSCALYLNSLEKLTGRGEVRLPTPGSCISTHKIENLVRTPLSGWTLHGRQGRHRQAQHPTISPCDNPLFSSLSSRQKEEAKRSSRSGLRSCRMSVA